MKDEEKSGLPTSGGSPPEKTKNPLPPRSPTLGPRGDGIDWKNPLFLQLNTTTVAGQAVTYLNKMLERNDSLAREDNKITTTNNRCPLTCVSKTCRFLVAETFVSAEYFVLGDVLRDDD